MLPVSPAPGSSGGSSREASRGATTGQPGLAPASLERLSRYTADLLGCTPGPAHIRGVHVWASRLRTLPGWLGYVFPVIAIAHDAGAVVAARPGLVQELRMAMGSDLLPRTLDAPARRRLHRHVRRLLPNAFTLCGDVRAVDAEAFQPSATAQRAEPIPVEDPAAASIRSRFDGAVFGVRGPRGTLVAWAALKLKSADVWEVAVATEADYRGRGYGRDAVSAATRYALEQGRLCLYVHDEENRSSAFVARSLGYRFYAGTVLAEY